MKTTEELNTLKNEVKALSKKLAELTEDELAQVSGGPEERTVLGLAAAVDCKKCKTCGRIFENQILTICPVCGGEIGFE